MVTEKRRKYLREWQRRYRANNRDKLRLLGRERWKKNRQNPEWVANYREFQKGWMRVKREDISYREKELERGREWYLKNRIKKIAYTKEWRRKNLIHRKNYQKEYSKKRMQDPIFRLRLAMSIRVSTALRERGFWKKGKTVELLGIDTKSYRQYLESKFLTGMSWENRSKWHIDHIRPLALFDLNDLEEQKKAFHYLNTQPLWAKDNLKKGKKYDGD